MTIEKQVKTELKKEVESLLRPRDWAELGLKGTAILSALGFGTAVMVITDVMPPPELLFNQAHWFALGCTVVGGLTGLGGHLIRKKNDKVRDLLRNLEED